MRQLSALVVVAACLAGCRGEPRPVARLGVEPHTVRLGFPELREVHFNWQPMSALGDGGAPVVFVHLLDRQGKVLRTFDHPFPGAWQEGVPASYDVKLYQSALAKPLAPGGYRLTAGLYGANGMRWPLAAGPQVARLEYQVADVEVPAGAGPPVSFVGAWLPSEPAGDRQVVARRWLAGAGAIALRDLPGPGSVWLVLFIPDAKGPGETMVFDDGANAPSVLVTGTCGGEETGLSGPGRHELSVAADGSAHGGSCDVRLKPNFTLVSADGRVRRSVAVETLAWTPAAARPAP